MLYLWVVGWIEAETLLRWSRWQLIVFQKIKTTQLKDIVDLNAHQVIMPALSYALPVFLSCRTARPVMGITKSLLLSAGPTVCVHSLGISNDWWQVLSVSFLKKKKWKKQQQCFLHPNVRGGLHDIWRLPNNGRSHFWNQVLDKAALKNRTCSMFHFLLNQTFISLDSCK